MKGKVPHPHCGAFNFVVELIMATGIKTVRKNGKVYKYPRDYKEEYKQRSKEQKENRQIRREARSKMEKKYGKNALKGKDVDHIKGIKKGNGPKNLRITSKKTNRSKK